MADKIVNDITLLFKTKLDEKSKQEVGKNLRGLLENAAIGFDEAETKRNLEPIVRMMQKLFDKAEIAFDADKLLAMPGKQALQEMAQMEVDRLQNAFDKALAKSGGIKIDFGDVDLSFMTEPLDQLTKELSDIGQRVASTTKKSVSDIESAIKKLNSVKVNAKNPVKDFSEGSSKKKSALDKTVTSIEEVLDSVNNQKKIGGEKSAVRALGKARAAYANSVANNDPWEIQYRHMVAFVSKYEAMSQKIKPIIDTNNPEFKQLYDIISPKAGAAKISLEHFVDVAKGRELTEYKNQPWGRERTLKEVRDILRNGISVKDGGGDSKGSGNNPPPLRDDDGGNKKIESSTLPPVADVGAAEAAEQSKKAEEERLRLAELRRAEEEKINLAAQKRIEEEKKAIEAYRGIIPPEEDYTSRREVLDGRDGAEWWASNKGAAQTYADMDEGGVVLVGKISPKNPLIIDAGGKNFNDFLNMPGIQDIAEQFPDLRQLIDLKADITDVQKYINTRAKELGYDVVQFDNVNDVLNPDAFREIGSTFAILDDGALKVSGAFTQLAYDIKEGLGDYTRKPSAEGIPAYYKMPDISEVKKEADVKYDSANAAEQSAEATEQELADTTQITAELEKQKKLLVYRRVEGELDPDRIKNRNGDSLYDRNGKPSIQEALGMGFGGFGDGLSVAPLSGARSLAEVANDGKTSFFEFDASDYKFYINETMEQAEAVREFLLSLQKLVGAGTILDETKLTDIKDLNGKELFVLARNLFENFNMTQEQFNVWLENAKKECANIAELFAQGEVPENHHNFGTRFMQELGYEGVRNTTGDEYYDGEEQGTVIFDPDVDKIKKSMVVFQTADEYLEHLKVTAQEAKPIVDAVNNSIKELTSSKQQQNNNIDDDETFEAEDVTYVELKNEADAHQQNTEAIKKEAEAQKELNTVKAQSLDDAKDTTGGVSDATNAADDRNVSSALSDELNAAINKNQALQDTIAGKDQVLSDKDTEITRVKVENDAKLQAEANEKARLQAELDAANKQKTDVEAGKLQAEERVRKVTEESTIKDGIIQELREQLGNVKTGENVAKASIDVEELKNVLNAITYNVKVVQDAENVDNKVAIDEVSLETTLNKVFANIINRPTQQNDGEQKQSPWALESTLQSVKAVLDQIQTNTARIGTPNSDAVKGSALSGTLGTIKAAIDAINGKIVQGTKVSVPPAGQPRSAVTPTTGNPLLDAKIDSKFSSLSLLYAKLEANGQLTDEIRDKWMLLWDSLDNVNDNHGLQLWNQQLAQVKNSIQEILIANNLLESEGKASFNELIGVTKLYNKMAVGAQNATTPELKSFYTNEANSLLVEQQRLLQNITLNKEQQAKLDELEISRKREINKIVAAQTDKRNQADLAEQVNIIKTLNKLYQEYGILVERAAFAEGNLKNELDSQIKEKNNVITNLRTSLAAVTPEMADEFNLSFERGKKIESDKQYISLAKKSDADEESRLKNIANLEKEIGKLRADADAVTNDGVKNALEEEIQLRERLIELQRQGLEMDSYDEAFYRQNAANRTKQAKSAAKQEADAIKEIFKEQGKEEKKSAARAKKDAQKEAMLGKTSGAVNRAENAWMSAAGIASKLSPEFAEEGGKIDAYYEKIQALRKLYQDLRDEDVISPEQINDVIKQTIELNKMTSEISDVIAEYQKLSGDNVDEAKTRRTTLIQDPNATLGDYKQQLTQYVKEITNGEGQVKSFNAETRTLTYAVKTGTHEFTEYTAAVRRADDSFVSMQGATKKTETFIEATLRKMKEISSYLSGMGLIQRLGQELKRGVQYIREIDSALAELKKVTDETEKAYDEFLQTAAKTAGKVGSTIKEIVSSTADWARLGSVLAKTSVSPLI